MDAGMNVFVIENLEYAEANYRPNRHRNPRNPIEELNEEQFVKMFRLSKDLFRYLMNRLEPLMRPQSRNSDLDIQSKILAALSFFANGSYQTNVGNNAYIDVSQASVCVSLREVVAALNEPAIYDEWVQFPENFNGLNIIRQGFDDQHGFPGVVGCIDCTHVAIVPPPGNDEAHPEHLYVNRKSYHSINVQLICDAQLRILNVNARFPGSTNDAYIWNQSAVQALLRNIHGRGERDYFLLGYQYCYPFLTPACGIKIENNWIKYLYKHIVNLAHPTMGFIGVPFKVCPFPMFDIQARFFLEFVKDIAKFSTEKMLDDILKDVNNRALPPHQVHKIGMTHHETYFIDLANTVNIKKIQPVIHKLYNFLKIHRNSGNRYLILNDEEFLKLD